MTLLRRWRALPSGDRRLLVEAAGWFLVLRVALRLLPFSRLTRWTEARGRPRADLRRDEHGPPAPQRIGWATAAVARRLAPERSCLAQALTARIMLGRRGVESTVHYGARRDPTAPFRAHAWLECDGAVLIGGEELAEWQEFRDRAGGGTHDGSTRGGA